MAKVNYYKHSSVFFKNYIYLKYYNYLKYSCKNPDTYLNNYQQKDLRIKMFHTKSLSQRKRQEIENYLNSFFPHNRGGKLKSEVSQETWQSIEKQVQTIFNKEYQDYDIDWDTLKVYKKYETDLNASLGKIDDFNKHYISVWDQKIQDLNKMLENFQLSDAEQSDLLSNDLNKLNAMWNDIIKTVPGVTVDKKGIRHGTIQKGTKGFEAFQKEYNELNNALFQKGDKKRALATGYLFEVLGAAMMCAMTTELNKGLLQVEDMLIGGKDKASHHGIDIKAQGALSQQQWGEILNKRLVNYKGNYFSLSTPEGKADIKFNFGRKDIFASLKNYNLKINQTISLVTHSPLRDLTQKDADFVAHYLNILSQHGYTKEDQLENREPNFATRALAHNTMRKLIFARSLAGGGYYEFRRDLTTDYSPQVDIFILNDNNQGRIKVYYVQDIIKKILDDINGMSIAEKITKKRKNGTSYEVQGYPSNDNYTYNIDGWERWNWYPPTGDYGRRRRAHLYKQLHNIKIKTSINTDLFKKDFGYKT